MGGNLKVGNRIEKLRSNLGEKEIDSFLVSQPENRYYLSGFDGSAGYLFITAKEAILATDFRYIERATAQAPDYQIYRISGKTEEWFPKLTSELNSRQLGFEAEHVTFAHYRQLTGILKKVEPELQLVPVDGFVESLRTIKEPEEIELISRAIEIGDQTFEHVREIIRPGMTEQQVAWEIEKFMRENGSQGIAFDSIVAAGPNSALPHAKPSERPIGQGEPVVLDLGGRVEGYCGDLTRTLCLGQPDDTFKKVYDTVLGAQLAAIALIKEGMSGHEADRMARIIIGSGRPRRASPGAKF
jgi:Xaa-Pro aminopeptidase